MTDQQLSDQAIFKREFVSKLAHDLKTPLTVISAYAQLITKKIENGESVDTELSNKIHQMAVKMADQITAAAKSQP